MAAYSRSSMPFFTSNRKYTPVNGYSDTLISIAQPIHSLKECKNPYSCQQKYSLGVKHNNEDDEQEKEYKEMLRNSDQARDDLERSLRFLQTVIEDAAEAEEDEELDEELLQMVEEGMEKLVEGLEYQVGALAVEIMDVDELERKSDEQFQERGDSLARVGEYINSLDDSSDEDDMKMVEDGLKKVVTNLSQPIRLNRADNRNDKRRSWDYHSMSRWRKGEQRIFNYKNNAFNSYPRVARAPMKGQRSPKYPNNQFPNPKFPNYQFPNPKFPNYQFRSPNFTNYQFPNPKFPNNQYPNNQPNILKPRNHYQSKCSNNGPNYNSGNRQFQVLSSPNNKGTRPYNDREARPNYNNNGPNARSNYHVIAKRRSFPSSAPRPISSRPDRKTRA